MPAIRLSKHFCTKLIVLTTFTCVLVLSAMPGFAQSVEETALQVERLALEVERSESLRKIKQVQDAYAQFAQAGLWSAMGALFADDAELVYGEDSIQGKAEITQYFQDTFGAGREGLGAGSVHLRMNERPVINLASDGESAQGRWLEFTTYGVAGGAAGWAGGIQTNNYILEDGVWKFSRLHYHAKVAGSWEDGWTALESDISVVPYHFTAQEAGIPILALPDEQIPRSSNLSIEASAALLFDLEQRVNAMAERDQVLNLYYVYGYYLDRKMWDDVTDLFTANGVLAIDGIGVYRGIQSIRRALENDGPAGLRQGELNDHLLFNTIVEISPNGKEARLRGLELDLEGDATEQRASVGVIVNEARFEKRGEVWRIQEIRAYPAASTDYYQGWAQNSRAAALPGAGARPDEALVRNESAIVEFFYPHPVTGAAISTPADTIVTGTGIPFSEEGLKLPASAGSNNIPARLAEAERTLRVARAYDGVENISGAFGDWLDDFQWDKFSALFAEDGRRRKYMLGFYTGPERIYAAETLMYGTGPRTPRTSVAVHHRLQRVINVAPDGMSAKWRTRLLNISMSANPGTLLAGIYPNDAARLEDGVWKFMNTSIDEPYWTSSSYKDGWARVAIPPAAAEPNAEAPPPLSPFFTRVLEQLPPDVPLSAMPNRQYGFVPGSIISWPNIKPMWFHYLNPVSGREPEYYCPDEFTCESQLEKKQPASLQIWNPVAVPEQVAVTEGYINSDGADLWYWDTGGKGEVLVFAHPASQSSEIWQYQQPYFSAAGYRVIAYSRRGYYKSTPGPVDDKGTTVGDLTNLLDALGIEQAHIVGAAAGGITAMAFAVEHPQRTRSLTLAGSIIGPNEPQWREMFGRLEMTKAKQHMTASFVELSASYRAGNPEGTEHFESLSIESTMNGPVSQPSGISVTWDVMENLKVPVLLLTGAADLYSPPSLQRLFAQHLQDVELEVVPESAHAIYWEQPEAFNRIVKNFIQQHSR